MKTKMIKVFWGVFSAVAILSFVFVYHANLEWQQEIDALAASGQPVFDLEIMTPGLVNVVCVFYASAFVTLTGGLFVALTASLLVAVFTGGRDTLWSAGKALCGIAVPGGALVLCFFIIFLCADASIFHRVRDYLLLSNPAGKALVETYYQYSPMAAHAVQSPCDRVIKTVWVSHGVPKRERVVRKFCRAGWISVEKEANASCVIQMDAKGEVAFQSGKRTVFTVPRNAFIARPGKWLRIFCDRTHHTWWVGWLCLAGLLAGLPLLIFGVLFNGIFFLASRWLSPRKARGAAGLMLVAGAVVLVAVLYPARFGSFGDPVAALCSPHPRDRIEALRILYGRGVDIGDTPGYLATHLKSRHVAERYWIAKNLSSGSGPGNLKILALLLNDPQIVVASAAAGALAKRPCSFEAVELLQHAAAHRGQWYLQIRLRNALRRCHGQ